MPRVVTPDTQRKSSKQAYAIEAVIGHRRVDEGTEYLVKWVGYGEDETTWEPRSGVGHTTVVVAYEDR